MSEQATDREQRLWDKVYVKSIASQLVTDKSPSEATTNRAKWLADESVKRRRDSIAARSPEAEPAKPAKVKRAPSKRLPCPGGGTRRADSGYSPCPTCKQTIGSVRGRNGWHVAAHKLPAKVG